VSFEIDGSLALVTGAAGGIGRCISARLAAAGAALALVDIDRDGAESLLGELGAKGVAIGADLSAPGDIAAAVAEAERQLGPLDILVNNAGISGVGAPKPSVDTPLEEWEKVLAVNVTAPLLFCQAVLPGMIERNRGRVLNVASMAALLALPGRISYAASKAALVSITKTLALECAGSEVRINAICPSWADTNFIAARLAQPELRAQVEASIPVGRVATPDEIADVALFLLSPASRYMTGAAVVVDGGLSLL